VYVDLEIGQGHPKSNQVRNIDHKTFLPNYIEIRPVVFCESRSQEIYRASANANASASAAGGFIGKPIQPTNGLNIEGTGHAPLSDGYLARDCCMPKSVHI
jgi:hypothetical protein